MLATEECLCVCVGGGGGITTGLNWTLELWRATTWGRFRCKMSHPVIHLQKIKAPSSVTSGEGKWGHHHYSSCISLRCSCPAYSLCCSLLIRGSWWQLNSESHKQAWYCDSIIVCMEGMNYFNHCRCTLKLVIDNYSISNFVLIDCAGTWVCQKEINCDEHV